MSGQVIVCRVDADTVEAWPAARERGTVAHGRVERRRRSRIVEGLRPGQRGVKRSPGSREPRRVPPRGDRAHTRALRTLP